MDNNNLRRDFTIASVLALVVITVSAVLGAVTDSAHGATFRPAHQCMNANEVAAVELGQRRERVERRAGVTGAGVVQLADALATVVEYPACGDRDRVLITYATTTGRVASAVYL